MEQTKYDVFISYSRKDTDVADKITKAFKDAGITFFIDRQGICGGMEFPAVLAKAIRDSKVFLFLASKNSYESKFSQSEIVYAFNKKDQKDIIPYIIDGSSLPEELELTFASINWRNMKEHPIETTLVDDVLQKVGKQRATHGDSEHNAEELPRIKALRSSRKHIFIVVLGLAVILFVFLIINKILDSPTDSLKSNIPNENIVEQKSKDDADIVVEATINKESVHIGDSVICEIRLYSNLSIADLRDLSQFSAYNADWKELDRPFTFENVEYKGTVCRSFLIVRYLLVPKEVGKVVVIPLRFWIKYITRDYSVDPFEAFLDGKSGTIEKDTIIKMSPLEFYVLY